MVAFDAARGILDRLEFGMVSFGLLRSLYRELLDSAEFTLLALFILMLRLLRSREGALALEAEAERRDPVDLLDETDMESCS